jgi:N-acetylmuramoyl-L-alanine amidase
MKSRFLVCLDPGHVSDYSQGTRGKRISEAELAWRYATQLHRLLEQRDFPVEMTKRSRNEKVSNQHRAEIANKAGANIFLRLHADARPEPGFAVYYPTRSGRIKEGVIGPPSEVRSLSRRAAFPFHDAMNSVLKGVFPDFGLFGDEKTLVGSQQGALTGSIFARVPVLLIEMGSLSNDRDEDFLLSKKGQQAMLAALVAGVVAAQQTLTDEQANKKPPQNS